MMCAGVQISPEVELLHAEGLEFETNGDLKLSRRRFEMAIELAASNGEIEAEIHNRFHLACLFYHDNELTQTMAVIAPTLIEPRYRTDDSIEEICAMATLATGVAVQIPLKLADLQKTIEDYEYLAKSSKDRELRELHDQLLIGFKGQLVACRGQVSEAISIYSANLSKYPEIYGKLANVELYRGDVEASERYWELCSDLSDQEEDSFENAKFRAKLSLSRGDSNDSLRWIRVAKEADDWETKRSTIEDIEFDLNLLLGRDDLARAHLTRRSTNRRSDSLFVRQAFFRDVGDYHLVSLSSRLGMPRFVPSIKSHKPTWPEVSPTLDLTNRRLAAKAALMFARMRNIARTIDSRLATDEFSNSAKRRMENLRRLGYVPNNSTRASS